MDNGYSMSPADVTALAGGGNTDMWNNPVIALAGLSLVGNGFFGGSDRNSITSDELHNRFDTQTILNTQTAIERDITAAVDTLQNGTFTLNNTAKDGFFGVQSQLCNNTNLLNNSIMQNSFANQQGFSDVTRAVDQCCCATNLNNERNTNAIISRIDAFENSHKDEVIAQLTSKINVDNTVQQILTAQGRYVGNPPCNYPCPCSAL